MKKLLGLLLYLTLISFTLLSQLNNGYGSRVRYKIENVPQEIEYSISKIGMKDPIEWTKSVNKAFDTWQEITKGLFNFKYIEQDFPTYDYYQLIDKKSRDNINLVCWINGLFNGILISGDIPNKPVFTQIYVWFDPKSFSTYIDEVDIIFVSDFILDDIRYSWESKPYYSKNENDVLDIEASMCHEIGHLLGIKDLLADIYKNCTMHPSMLPGNTSKRNLTDIDIKLFRELYSDINYNSFKE